MKQKIFLFILVSGIIGSLGFVFLLNFSGKNHPMTLAKPSGQTGVRGTSTTESGLSNANNDPTDNSTQTANASTGIQSEVTKKLAAIKEQISKLTTQDLTSSSSALPKIINDLQSLTKQPNKAIQQQCENVCRNL